MFLILVGLTIAGGIAAAVSNTCFMAVFTARGTDRVAGKSLLPLFQHRYYSDSFGLLGTGWAADAFFVNYLFMIFGSLLVMIGVQSFY